MPKNETKIQSLGNKLKHSKGVNEIRTELFAHKKVLKNLVQWEKRQHKQSIVNRMNNKDVTINPKDYWKLFNKLKPKNWQNTCNIPHETLTEYFKNLLTANRELNIPPDSKENSELDYPFTKEELEKANSILKSGKATGMDNLSNEMIFCLTENYPELVVKLYNLILSKNKTIPDWSIGMIVPIHKKGSQRDPENYRGISLLSCLGKLFTTLLKNRLLYFAMKNKIFSDSQLGFLPKNRTSDAHLIIHNVIQKYCHNNNTKVFSCFIDFSKAFDTIPRDILLQKLLQKRIKGHFFNTIKNMYTNDKACIKIENKVTETFEINQGIRQGCILSPLLFNIYLADLPEKLERERNLLNPDSTMPNCLLWADDIIIMAESEIGLKNMLSALNEYCKENQLKINTNKTKCMIFNKTGRHIRKTFSLNDIELETVREFKYLGFLITPSGEIRSGLKDLRDRALKAFYKLKTAMGTAFNRDIQLTLKLVDALIKPILL